MSEWASSHPNWAGIGRFAKPALVLAAVVAWRHTAGAEAPESTDPALAVKAVSVRLLCARNNTIDAIVNLLCRHIEQRCDARVSTFGQAGFRVELGLAEGIGKEGFQIEDGGRDAVRIVGNDARGLLYGVGKFLRTSRYDGDGLTPGLWRGRSVPQKEVRGMYFCTHFHNFYHDAPMAELEQYVEDVILWGVNSIVMRYDMHHFKGFDDPRAAELRHQIRHIAQAAAKLGADVGLVAIANEGYGDSPRALRRDGSALRTKSFATDICPSKPGGMEYTLGNFRQLLDHFSGIKPAHVLIFAYDSGGCSCAQCRPWVTNGYPKAAARVARLVKEKHPGAEVALVTWAFTPDEWADLNKAVAARPADWEWADSVLATLVVGTGGASPRFFLFDAPKKAGDAATARLTCGDRPLLAFARMGAHDMYPWGAFGANPTPEGCQAAWNLVKHQSHGGWPYSEGIFDDINKAIFTQFGWSPDRPASEIVREYVAFEYSPDVVEDVCRAIKTLECNHRVLRWVDGMLIDRVERNPDKPEPAPPDPATDAAYKTLQRMETKLTAYARNSWRWRILYLRALLDSELRRNGGRPTKQCEEAFRELTEIYHAQKAGAPIKPPGP